MKKLIGNCFILMILTGASGCGKRNELSELIQNSQKVSISRIDPESLFEKLGSRKVIEGPIDLSPKDEVLLKNIISSIVKKERDSSGRGCEPLYGAFAEFLNGNTKIKIYFCMNCSIFLIEKTGKKLEEFDFEPRENEIAKIMETYFGKDVEIE